MRDDRQWTMEEGHCALCGTSPAETLYTIPGTAFAVRRCGCGLAYLSPRVPASQVETLYPQTYYGTGNQRFRWGLEGVVALLRRGRARRVGKLMSSGRILDIGCGRGLFLHYLRRKGWEVYGTEISEMAAQRAKGELGLDVAVGPLQHAGWPEETFDVVSLWHVFEHLPNPLETLTEIRRITRPGGWLILALPNIDSWQAQVTGPHWYHLDVPRHYYFYSPQTLRRLLEWAGYEVVQVTHLSLEHNLHAFVHSLLNRLGFSHNLSYTLWRSGAAGKRMYRRSEILLLGLLLPGLGLLACLFSVLEALCRKGATIEVYAKKLP